MKPVTHTAIAFLVLVALLHALRLLLGWELVVNGVSIPVWASALGALIAGGFAFGLWKESS